MVFKSTSVLSLNTKKRELELPLVIPGNLKIKTSVGCCLLASPSTTSWLRASMEVNYKGVATKFCLGGGAESWAPNPTYPQNLISPRISATLF